MSLSLFRQLTDREYEVMLLVVEGNPNKGIADMLGISERTVKHHRRAVMEKLQVSSVAKLVTLAVRNEIV